MSEVIKTPTPANHLATVGEIANVHAAASAFSDYLDRKSDNTRRRQRDDLANFANYLSIVLQQCTADDVATHPAEWRARFMDRAREMQSTPAAWAGMTWGMVAGYREWMKREGYAVKVINLRLSTVRVYCKLAAQAGAIAPDAMLLIKGVNGYSHSEGDNLDEVRPVTRISTRKVDANLLSAAQVKALRRRPNTPQGRRDAVLIGLLVVLGLRVGECVGLTVANVDLERNTLTVYRQKVKKVQTLNLINGLGDDLRAYMLQDMAGAPATAPLLRASRKGGELTHAGLSRFSIADHVAHMGRELNIDNLSPHDLRHTWATRAVANKTDAFTLRDAGGWSTMAMPSHYAHAAKIANEGVKLDD
jgi:integrase